MTTDEILRAVNEERSRLISLDMDNAADEWDLLKLRAIHALWDVYECHESLPAFASYKKMLAELKSIEADLRALLDHPVGSVDESEES